MVKIGLELGKSLSTADILSLLLMGKSEELSITSSPWMNMDLI